MVPTTHYAKKATPTSRIRSLVSFDLLLVDGWVSHLGVGGSRISSVSSGGNDRNSRCIGTPVKRRTPCLSKFDRPSRREW
jgi:hypothetical protein